MEGRAAGAAPLEAPPPNAEIPLSHERPGGHPAAPSNFSQVRARRAQERPRRGTGETPGSLAKTPPEPSQDPPRVTGETPPVTGETPGGAKNDRRGRGLDRKISEQEGFLPRRERVRLRAQPRSRALRRPFA